MVKKNALLALLNIEWKDQRRAKESKGRTKESRENSSVKGEKGII
jgi:hypothetical protein